MGKDSEKDPSYSQQSNEVEQSEQRYRQHVREQQQSTPCLPNGNEYAILFSIHGKSILNSKFPFHHYLKQHYKRLSLQEQIRIFQSYFKCIKNQDKQMKISRSHLQILNEGISLFTKVPQNAMLFISIENQNEKQQLVTVKNYNGEIIHFQKIKIQNKRSTTIVSIKRKLKKGKPFFAIKDNGNLLKHPLNKKTFIKLSENINFLYFKIIKSKQDLQQIRRQFRITSNQSWCWQIVSPRGKKIQVGFDANFTYFYAYFNDFGPIITDESITDFKRYIYQHFQTMRNQELKIIETDTQANRYGVRLKVFDYMYINFLKTTGKNKQQFVQIIDKMSIKYAHINLDDIESHKDHFPQRILNSRRCKCCEILGRGINKKSKYKCLGCSKKFEVDIPLCISCFGDFHEVILPTCRQANVKQLKKTYQAHISKSIGQNESFSQQNQNINQYSNNQQLNSTIIKLNENINEIEKLMDQLFNESLNGAKVVKYFNQALFLNIINSFNNIMDQNQDQSKSNQIPQSQSIDSPNQSSNSESCLENN